MVFLTNKSLFIVTSPFIDIVDFKFVTPSTVNDSLKVTPLFTIIFEYKLDTPFTSREFFNDVEPSTVKLLVKLAGPIDEEPLTVNPPDIIALFPDDTFN